MPAVEGERSRSIESAILAVLLIWVLAALGVGLGWFCSVVYDPDLLWHSELVTHKKRGMILITPTSFIVQTAIVSAVYALLTTFIPFAIAMTILLMFRDRTSTR